MGMKIMYICKKCKRICSTTNETCKCGNKKYKPIDHINTPVFLTSTSRYERELITAALYDAEIPFAENNTEKHLNDKMITGNDLQFSGYDVLIPYSAIPKAADLLNAIGATDVFDETLLPEITNDIEQKKKAYKDNEASKSFGAKQTAIKIISAIAFFLLIALAVWGTDYIMEIIKRLF